MAGITQTYVVSIKDDAARVVASDTHIATGDAEETFNVACAGSNGTVSVPLTIDVSTLEGFYVMSTQAVTMTLNDDGTPDQTISLSAGVAWWWYNGKGTNPITIDLTGPNALKFTNAGTTAAVIKGGFLTT